MLTRLVLAIIAVLTTPFRGPVNPHDRPYDATPYGPQSWEEAALAREALQGENDDIRYHEEYEPSDAGIKWSRFRWPGFPGSGTIPLYYDEDVEADEELKGLLEDAKKQYHEKTCIRFVKWTDETHYVKVIKVPKQCYSYVGKIPSPQPQPLSLGFGCGFLGTVVHELGHAVGLYHMHQRSDRDNFINVYEDNVAEGAGHNFNKTNARDEIKSDDYDYKSIMHYGEYAFSKDPGNLKTMVAKDGQTVLKEPYNKPGLDDKDVELIKRMYRC